MAIYIYRCSVCKKEKEMIHKMSENPHVVCENSECINFGEPISRVLQPTKHIIKGYYTAKTGYSKDPQYARAVERKRQAERRKG